MAAPGLDQQRIRLFANLLGERQRVLDRTWLIEELRMRADPNQSTQDKLRDCIPRDAGQHGLQPATVAEMVSAFDPMRVDQDTDIRQDPSRLHRVQQRRTVIQIDPRTHTAAADGLE